MSFMSLEAAKAALLASSTPVSETEDIDRSAAFNYSVKEKRMEFVRVQRNAEGGLDLNPKQDFAIVSPAEWTDGVAAIPAAVATVCAGDGVAFVSGPRW